jgi:hypothetical protein
MTSFKTHGWRRHTEITTNKTSIHYNIETTRAFVAMADILRSGLEMKGHRDFEQDKTKKFLVNQRHKKSQR